MPTFAFDVSQSRTFERSALQDVCESNEHAWRSAAIASLADARRVASETLSGQIATLDRLLPKWLSTSRELADAMEAIGWRRQASAAWFADRDQ
jgi:hypothetical protein